MSEPIPVEQPKLPSDEFMDAVRNGGGIRRECGLCGRTCFEDDRTAGDWETGELEELQRLAIEQPDKYVALERVETGEFNGHEVVVNCPCGKLRPFEDFIWNHRRLIMKYLSGKVRARAEAAYAEEAEAEHAVDAVESDDKREEEAAKKVRSGKNWTKAVDAMFSAKAASGEPEKTFRCSDCGRMLREDMRVVNTGECKDCFNPF